MTLLTGIHRNIPSADYFADPCPEPSLTQSIAKIILEKSPAHARLAHPRLNLHWEPRDQTKYDIGHIAHRMILGRGRELQIIEGFDDWRKKDAQAARLDAADHGKLGVLERDYDTGAEMMEVAMRQLKERGYQNDWFIDANPNVGEVVVIARTPMMIWLRAMIDWLPWVTRIWDYKSTGTSAAPSEVWRRMVNDGWCIQAAFHERILNMLDPSNAGRREHRFIVQENYAPYALTVVRLTEAHMTIGRAQVARAEAIWAECMTSGKWPAYPTDELSPEYPAWAMLQVMHEPA